MFWYSKGINNFKKTNYFAAIECFKQTLILEPSHFYSIFVIACCYELLKNYSTSLKWFEFCKTFHRFRKKVLFGLALNHYKLGNNADSFNYIFHLWEHKTNNMPFEYLYLKILTSKQNELKHKTNSDYNKLKQM